MLVGRNVALGVTGSIAAVRTVELAHELRRHGAEVRAVTTPSAESIIHPWALESATDRPVVTEITGALEHVDLCGQEGWADVLLVAPATANTVGKLANAIDDTPVTTCGTTAIGAGMPVVLAPAMHEPMYDHPGVQEALEQVQAWGIEIVDPVHEEGKAKIASEEAIVSAVARLAGDTPLADHDIIVTSGATSESIDPVRVLTNRSSGKMGQAIARACYVRGADVTLIHAGPDVPYATVEQVTSAEDMRHTAVRYAQEADVLISAAAIGDFQVQTASEKLNSREPVSLDLEPAPKLLDAVRETAPNISLVGFKVEHNADESTLATSARSLLERIDATFVVANDASTMGADDTDALVVDESETERIQSSKAHFAAFIADRITDAIAD